MAGILGCSMTLALATKKLGWPTEAEMFNPTGSGPRILAELADRKIGQSLRRMPGGLGVRVGILATDPRTDATEAPLAIVCEFRSVVPMETVRETHRLAWNFSRSPLVFIVEPHQIRVWTCCEPPLRKGEEGRAEPEIECRSSADIESSSIVDGAASSLHWLRLVSGEYFRTHEDRLNRRRCADALLLSNLTFARDMLEKLDLPRPVAHDLLARIIFIQFLFHRKDSSGKAALNVEVLAKLQETHVLTGEYRELEGILRSHHDTYALFSWLNERFNGDLFPGRATDQDERAAEWRAELDAVQPKHLNLLSEFVGGRVVMEQGQLCLWPQYMFDAIPLEFISSIYEVFVGDRPGVHYTPSHLVDYILDEVLPWHDTTWDLRILDPACGSGIFLVKAFQRLVARWRNAHPGEEPGAAVLRQFLEHNLVGVDIDGQAVRVASFSLYLAMCDEIEPRHYWKTVRFPRLRGLRLVPADFFANDSVPDGPEPVFDLVLGNAPWGRGTVTDAARKWARAHHWKLLSESVGPLFLPKAAGLLRAGGRVAMLQPAGPLLLNRTRLAASFRHSFFATFRVYGITNLSALRFGLFAQSIAPACVVTLGPERPDGEAITYCCPKPCRSAEDDYRIVVEPDDLHAVHPSEAAGEAIIWTALMWGGRRDLALIRRLQREPNLGSYKESGRVSTREGINRGDRGRNVASLVGRRILDDNEYLTNTFLTLDAAHLPVNEDPETDAVASTDFSSFEPLQLIIKPGWQIERGRFLAARVDASRCSPKGVLCSQSFINVRFDRSDGALRDTVALVYNSVVAVYFLLLTSGRFAAYRPEPLVAEILAVPLPPAREGACDDIRSEPALDLRVREMFGFKNAEWLLVADLIRFTLPDFKGSGNSPGLWRTQRSDSADNPEPDLAAYCESFLAVLRAGFGSAQSASATIFHETDANRLPLRLVAIHLAGKAGRGIVVRNFGGDALYQTLTELVEAFAGPHAGSNHSVFYQRVAKICRPMKIDGHDVATVFMLKPDRRRYWTASMAMRDADDVAAGAMTWAPTLDEVQHD